MAKKKKRASKKSPKRSVKRKDSKQDKIHESLVKYTIYLQKITIGLIKSNTELVDRIDKLVGLFEEASKHISSGTEEEEIKNLSMKLESLTLQNKDLAKAIVLLEEYVRDKSMSEEFRARPLPR